MAESGEPGLVARPKAERGWRNPAPRRSSRRGVLAGLGCALAAPAVRAQTGGRDFTIPISSTTFATASVRAAHDLGCFARNGLNVRFPMMETGANLTAALISGSVQMVVGGSGEQVTAAARGQPVVNLANVYWGLSATVVLARSVVDRLGVAPTASVADRLKALDGVLLASPSATSNYTNSFKGAAEAVGARIRYVYMAQPAMVAALESNAIQGYTAGAPLWGAQVARGKAVAWLSGPKGDLPRENTPASLTSFHVMRPFADGNPDLVRRVLGSYREFSDILDSRPGEVRGALSRVYPEIDAATMDVLFEAEKGAWRMRPLTVDDMKQDIAFMVASGSAVPGIERIDPSSLIYDART